MRRGSGGHTALETEGIEESLWCNGAFLCLLEALLLVVAKWKTMTESKRKKDVP